MSPACSSIPPDGSWWWESREGKSARDAEVTLKPLPFDEERFSETRGRVGADQLAELDAARRSLQTARQELQSLQLAFDQAQRELKTGQDELEAARRDSFASRELVRRGEAEIATL